MKTHKLAILLSGSGSTAQVIIQACQAGKLPAVHPVVVISNVRTAAGLVKARALGIKIDVIEKKGKTMNEFENNLLKILRAHHVDLVSQNGWLPLTPPGVVEAFKGRIINQHPGPLDPGHVDFGGIGMYGKRVTAAKIAYAWMTGKDYWTEATTHQVSDKFDEGEIIRTEKLTFKSRPRAMTWEEIEHNSSDLLKETELIASRLLPLEHKNVLATFGEFSESGQFPVYKRKARLVTERNDVMIQKAKQLAISLYPHA